MKTLGFYTQELKASQARLKALTEQGAKALSDYDIEIASGGNAEESLRIAKMLVGNHIKYYRRLIAEIKKEPVQLELL